MLAIRRVVCTTLFCTLTLAAFAQSNKPAAGNMATGKIYDFVEWMPVFNGDLQGFLRENLRYPDIARDSGCDGHVVIAFVVRKDGSVTDISVFRSSGCTSTDEEYLRVVRKMPKWKPGKQNGVAVDVRLKLPIIIHLE